MSVPYAQLGIWNSDMKYVVESRNFEVKIGRSFDDIRLVGNFKLVE